MRYDIITEEQLDEFVKAEAFYRVVLFNQRRMDGREDEWWAIQKVEPEQILIVDENETDIDDTIEIEEEYDEDGNHKTARDVYVFDDVREAWNFYCDKKIEKFNKEIKELEKARDDIEASKTISIASIERKISFWKS